MIDVAAVLMMMLLLLLTVSVSDEKDSGDAGGREGGEVKGI